MNDAEIVREALHPHGETADEWIDKQAAAFAALDRILERASEQEASAARWQVEYHALEARVREALVPPSRQR